ncbi:MAG: M23 family metallopeptidase [Cyanobacteria bacterium J06626_6]
MFWPRTSKHRPATAIAGLFVQLSFLSAVAAGPGMASTACPAALESTEQHQVEPGETLASIAAAYSLGTTTLAQFNPELNTSPSAALAAGSEITIPPFNGRVVSVNSGESWQSLAERHSSRADVLFEVNGCVSAVPNQIFVPMATPIAPTASRPTTLQLPGYPLSQPASISRSYGWQPHTTRDELVFNSGMAFEISEPIDVRSVGSGTVAFAGEREGYGLLLVINHEQGLQTRYANLSNISVSVGQPVTVETTVGKVGSNAPTFLYFEVRTNSSSGWIAQDPGKYLPALELR